MSPVFRHGRLRLYLLKLLDESPRHGYEVIRLLQDRFMGVYAPSPGTIYPRLARLEEDGLVTHQEINGKKVYSITDKGREEIRSRLSDLADLEDELSESLRDVAREISEDVRDTVRSIREEIASAAREFRTDGARKNSSTEESPESPDSGARTDEASQMRDSLRRNREQMRAGFRAQRRSFGDRSWQDWADGAAWSAWSDWPGGRKVGDAKDHDTGQADTGGSSTRNRRGGPNPFADLERMAMQFATELRAAARQTGDLGERSLTDLRDILTDTLARVRTEVFGDGAQGGGTSPTGCGTSPEEGDRPWTARSDDEDTSPRSEGS